MKLSVRRRVFLEGVSIVRETSVVSSKALPFSFPTWESLQEIGPCRVRSSSVKKQVFFFFFFFPLEERKKKERERLVW